MGGSLWHDELTEGVNGVTEQLLELQEHGQSCYRTSHFNEALRYFTKAVNLNSNAPNPILDNRAATYIKLGNLDAALNDGRKMIEQDKTDLKAYLRTQQILLLLDNRKMALDICNLGVRKIPYDSQDYQILKKLRDRIATKVGCDDPLKKLPLEVVEMVLAFLEFKELVRLTRVSKAWQKLLVSLPKLWSDLDFARANRPVKLGTVRAYVNRAKGNVTRVVLDRFGKNVQQVPLHITMRCPALQELRLTGGYIGQSTTTALRHAGNLKVIHLSPECQITIDNVIEIFRLCPNLETAQFHRVSMMRAHPAIWSTPLPKLQCLNLTAGGIHNQISKIIDLVPLLATIPNIRNLSLIFCVVAASPTSQMDFTSLHNLENLDVRGLKSPFPLILPSSIQSLNMGECLIPSLIFGNASRLTHLSVAHVRNISISQLMTILKPNKGNLKFLDLSEFPLEKTELRELTEQGYLRKVEELKLTACIVDDALATTLSTNVTALKTLSLARTSVTGVGIKAIVTACERTLQYLDVDDCTCAAFDAVKWARTKGVVVSFHLSGVSRGGRRVRE